MQTFKEKLYNYETPAPQDTWSLISDQLTEQKIVQTKGFRKKTKVLYYSLTAAAAVLVILISTLFIEKKPTAELTAINANASKTTNTISSADSVSSNNQLLKKIISTPENQKLSASTFLDNGFVKKYITIAGPEGQPVKISPKVATLILSANNEYPPKPVWDEKIDEWQQIMLTNPASTSTELMDILLRAGNNLE